MTNLRRTMLDLFAADSDPRASAASARLMESFWRPVDPTSSREGARVIDLASRRSPN